MSRRSAVAPSVAYHGGLGRGRAPARLHDERIFLRRRRHRHRSARRMAGSSWRGACASSASPPNASARTICAFSASFAFMPSSGRAPPDAASVDSLRARARGLAIAFGRARPRRVDEALIGRRSACRHSARCSISACSRCCCMPHRGLGCCRAWLRPNGRSQRRSMPILRLSALAVAVGGRYPGSCRSAAPVERRARRPHRHRSQRRQLWAT